MKRLLTIGIILFTVLIAVFNTGCRKNKSIQAPVVKSEADKLNEALGLKGTLIKGKFPAVDSLNPPDLRITDHIREVEVAAGVAVYLSFVTNDNENVAKLYIQVEGATSYWEVPVVNNTSVTTFDVEVNVPSFAQIGDFKLVTAAAGKAGKACVPVETKAIVTPPLKCPTDYEGSIGVTVKTVDLSDKSAGWVTVWYNTYTIPDRVDLKYNKEWVASTAGSLPPQSYYPSMDDCSNGKYPDNGFVSGISTLKFYYDPAKSKSFDIYVHGCDGNTLWTINVSCPDNAFYAGLPDCPCEYSEVQAKDGKSEGGGTWQVCGSASSDYHYGASKEARWLPSVSGKSGQQCTYDSYGALITAGIAAGSPDKVSPGGCGFWTWLFSSTGTMASYEGHKDKDITPWKTVPCWQYLRDWKANNTLACSENKITDISGQQISAMVIEMTCEEVTTLFKAIDESSASTYSIKNFFKNGSSMSWAQIRIDLNKVKDSYSLLLNESKIKAIEKAIAKIP